MNKALFLDRDGIINIHNEYVFKIEDFIFKNDVFKLCSSFQSKLFKIFVITNQAGIAKKIFSIEDLNILNEYMIDEFNKRQIHIEHIYFCPHHPDYDIDSFDRKPNPGMLLRAENDFDINLSESLFIGDQISDMKAGISAGVGRNYILNSKIDESVLPNGCTKIESLLDLVD